MVSRRRRIRGRRTRRSPVMARDAMLDTNPQHSVHLGREDEDVQALTKSVRTERETKRISTWSRSRPNTIWNALPGGWRPGGQINAPFFFRYRSEWFTSFYDLRREVLAGMVGTFGLVPGVIAFSFVAGVDPRSASKDSFTRPPPSGR